MDILNITIDIREDRMTPLDSGLVAVETSRVDTSNH